VSPREPFRRVRLGTILALLLLVTIVPLGLFAGQLVFTSWQQQQDLVNGQNVERARAISVAVDQEVQSTITALNALAALEPIDAENLRPFYDSATRMLPLQPGWQAVRLVEPGSRVVVNTAVPFGEPSTLVNDDWIRLVRDTKRPAGPSVRRDPATGQFFVSIGVPVARDGQLRYVLGARILASEFSGVLLRQQAPPDGVVALMDADLTIFARTRAEDVYLGAKPSPDFAAAIRGAPEGALRSRLLEGTPSFSAYSRSPVTGWTIGLGLPASAVDGPILESLWLLVAVGVAILGSGLLMAFLVRWRIVRAQVAVVTAARALARGEPTASWTSRVTEFNALAEGLRDAGAILERRLRERDDAERERARAASELENALIREHAARVTGERNEARLLVTLGSIGDAVIATDAEGRVTVINAVAQALTGWSEPDAIGTPIDTVFVTLDERARQPNSSLLTRIAATGGGVTLPSQAVLIARDGREIPIGDSASPIQTAGGTLLGLVVVFRDTTAERDAERQRVAAFEREQSARRTAEAMSRAKDEFVATVSHELRTPLNAIFGWVAMLKLGALDAAGQAKALDVIDRNTRVQAQLIDDLLDMARVIRGTVRLEMQPVDLAAVVESAVDAVKPAADARRVTLRVHAPRGIALVSGDASRLQQVAWNLLSNSIKFSNTGDEVDVSLGQEGDDAVLRVRDTGAGIDPAFLPHVFERFRQETSDVTSEHAGLGLGLSLVRHLAELHGGTVTAESTGKTHGATFTVRLPLVGVQMARQFNKLNKPTMLAMDAADSTQLPDAPPHILRNLYVLAVDDDPDARELVAAVLDQAGAQVTRASSVREAMASIESRLPDVVITDIAMPHATGFDLVRQLRAMPLWCETPVIALTAYARAEDRAQALSLGFTAHLGKPFSPRALVALVAQVGLK
jgi:PAS domain S-box-containing protein